MKLKDCRMGVLVQNVGTKEVGMVVGITNNLTELKLSGEQRDPSRAIPLVQWQSGNTHGIHYKNLELLK